MKSAQCSVPRTSNTTASGQDDAGRPETRPPGPLGEGPSGFGFIAPAGAGTIFRAAAIFQVSPDLTRMSAARPLRVPPPGRLDSSQVTSATTTPGAMVWTDSTAIFVRAPL